MVRTDRGARRIVVDATGSEEQETARSVRSLLGQVVEAGREDLGAKSVLIAAAHRHGWLVQAYCGKHDDVAPGTSLDPDTLPGEGVHPVELLRRPDGSLALTVAGEPLEPTTKGSGIDTVAHLRERIGEQRMLLVVEGSTLHDGELHQAVHRLLDAVQDSVAIQLGQHEQRLRAGLREREEERHRWARELHDETLQELGALQVLLSSARRSAVDRLPAGEPLLEAVDTAIHMLAEEITGLRHLITELRPAGLDELGLVPPLLALAERTEALTGLHVRLQVSLRSDDGKNRLLPDIELAIYRVVQEALTNAGRHSGASQAWVSVVESEDSVCAEVADNGRGKRTTERGFGLEGMRERAALAGGSLEVASRDGRGTLVRLVVPATHRRETASSGDVDGTGADVTGADSTAAEP